MVRYIPYDGVLVWILTYAESGLDDVQLVGVTVHRCRQCGEKMAELPALNQLHRIIGLLLTGKQSKLTGAELRFLRNELQINQKAFAGVVPRGVNGTIRFWLSRNEPQPPASARLP
jgi:DNA-binding transcriptional regulator YiaG